MFTQQFLQLDLLLQHRPLLTSPPLPPPSLPIRIRILLLITHQSRNIIPFLLILALLIPRMIHAQHAPKNRSSGEIIHSQIRTALVLILKKRETTALAGFLVPHEIDVHGFAVLREDGHHVAFGEIERKPADVEVGCVTVVGMPGCFGGAFCLLVGMYGWVGVGDVHGVFEFAFVEGLNLADLIHFDACFRCRLLLYCSSCGCIVGVDQIVERNLLKRSRGSA